MFLIAILLIKSFLVISILVRYEPLFFPFNLYPVMLFGSNIVIGAIFSSLTSSYLPVFLFLISITFIFLISSRNIFFLLFLIPSLLKVYLFLNKSGLFLLVILTCSSCRHSFIFLWSPDRRRCRRGFWNLIYYSIFI